MVDVPRNADFYKVLPLFEISISFKWPLKFFGITPSAPTTIGITFVVALQSLDIPLLSLCL